MNNTEYVYTACMLLRAMRIGMFAAQLSSACKSSKVPRHSRHLNTSANFSD